MCRITLDSYSVLRNFQQALAPSVTGNGFISNELGGALASLTYIATTDEASKSTSGGVTSIVSTEADAEQEGDPQRDNTTTGGFFRHHTDLVRVKRNEGLAVLHEHQLQKLLENPVE